MLRNLEECFQKHADSIHVFENTYEEFLTAYTKLNFPCTIHETEILTDKCSTFIIMRMRQFTYIKNQMSKKKNKTKKKLSKLVAT